MNNLIGTGIIATLIITFWQKVKGVLWYFVSFFICETKFHDDTFKFGAIFCWDKLQNKKSLSPHFWIKQYGSGENQRVFIRETGFRNIRFFRIGRILVWCKTDGDVYSIYGLKPFINHEKIYLAAIQHYECDKTREITISSSSNGFEIKENNYGIYFELS